MKIFYGVQGTGNGHITRARVMAKALQAQGIETHFLFTGRPADKYFDMEVFNAYQTRTGLTFNTNKGQVSYLKTALDAKPITFVKDIRSLDLAGYDHVITDFEPVTAWAAKLQKRLILGVGHQYAFNYTIPRAGGDPIANQVMRSFAPVTVGVGLHWHHFGQTILPPIIETPELPETIVRNKIVVYLPFEDQNKVIALLAQFPNFDFHLYSPDVPVSGHANITCNPLSRNGFQKDLFDCAGIISNAGFELASEALQLGKKILVKPLHSQMEQLSNAVALKELGYGHTMKNLDGSVIGHWLADDHAIQISYPNVAEILVRWLLDGMPKMDADFVEQVWSNVNVLKVDLAKS
jgi:uncharacterized protein (TIGR00661 family)